MKNKLLYSLIAGAVVMTGLSSCDNEEFLNVTHYSILEMSTMYESFTIGTLLHPSPASPIANKLWPERPIQQLKELGIL